MSQYKEEQLGEIFSLESIYPDELIILEEEPFHQFTLSVKSEGHDADDSIGYSCTLKFTYTPTYPEEPPLVEVTEDVNMDDEQIERLRGSLEKEAEENLGMVMIFTLVSAANEWLNTEWDSELKRREEEAERKLLEAEELENKKCHGTPVTVDNFLSWKAKFDDENVFTFGRDVIQHNFKKMAGKEIDTDDNPGQDTFIRFTEVEPKYFHYFPMRIN
nr:EOG090X0F6V [Chydorus sphaericus]